MAYVYPKLVECVPPPFIAKKYKDVRGLLTSLKATTEGQLPAFLAVQVAADFPTIDALFAATHDALVAAFVRAIPPEEVTTDAAPATEEDGGDQDEPPSVIVAAARYACLLQRLLLWEDPSEVFDIMKASLVKKLKAMPRTLKQIEEGKDGKDPIDPFNVAFTARFLGRSKPQELIEAILLHKCMMMLEDAVGHLQEEVLGRAGGCQRIPQSNNPYDGMDARRDEDEFYEIKNKMGSATGTSGRFMGQRFKDLSKRFPASRRFYVSLVGRDTNKHRSKGPVAEADPDADIMVGLLSFQQLGRHRDTPDIVLGFYLEAFHAALEENRYDFAEVARGITTEWEKKHGQADPAYSILRDTILPPEGDPEGKQQNTKTADSDFWKKQKAAQPKPPKKPREKKPRKKKERPPTIPGLEG